MMIYALILIVILMILGGFYLTFAGWKEKTEETQEYKNMSRRFDRVSTSTGSLLAGRAGGRDSALSAQNEVDKEFAKEEELRATNRNRRRETSYLPSLNRLAAQYTWLSRMEDDLTQARSPWRATELIAGSIMLAAATLVVLLLWGWTFFALFVAVPIVFFPWIYVKTKRAAFYRKFDDQLADALMLMSNSLRAGFSFMQSMEMVGKEAPAPISEEFTRVTQEIAIGVPVPEALMSMTDRIKSVDLSLVVTAVIIQREVGGALAQLLELIAEVIRERQRIKGEIRTLTAQGRLTGVILGLMPFTVGILILLVGRMTAPDDPPFIQPLIATDLGHLILAGALIWEIIGFWLIMKIVNIRV